MTNSLSILFCIIQKKTQNASRNCTIIFNTYPYLTTTLISCRDLGITLDRTFLVSGSSICTGKNVKIYAIYNKNTKNSGGIKAKTIIKKKGNLGCLAGTCLATIDTRPT